MDGVLERYNTVDHIKKKLLQETVENTVFLCYMDASLMQKAEDRH